MSEKDPLLPLRLTLSRIFTACNPLHQPNPFLHRALKKQEAAWAEAGEPITGEQRSIQKRFFDIIDLMIDAPRAEKEAMKVTNILASNPQMKSDDDTTAGVHEFYLDYPLAVRGLFEEITDAMVAGFFGKKRESSLSLNRLMAASEIAALEEGTRNYTPKVIEGLAPDEVRDWLADIRGTRNELCSHIAAPRMEALYNQVVTDLHKKVGVSEPAPFYTTSSTPGMKR